MYLYQHHIYIFLKERKRSELFGWDLKSQQVEVLKAIININNTVLYL